MSIPVQRESVFAKQIHPYKQLIVCLGLLVIIMSIIKACFSFDGGRSAAVFWEVAFAILMGYALFNSIFSLAYKERGSYFRDSIFSFLAIGAAGGLMAYWYSGLGIDEAGSFRWLYVVFGFSYLVFISIVNLMRKIIEIVKKQDARLRGEE